MWDKLERLPLQDNDVVFDYSTRLAKENQWSRHFAARVIQEYKRFLLMAMQAGHPVTPSKAVDQAWHLHLVYTRSYWEKLCQGVLGRPLHHEPTQGGYDEAAKFRQQYERTLASYERLFGEPAPADIWGSVEQEFKPQRSRWVDATRYWLMPKPAWVGRLRASTVAWAAGAALFLLLLSSCQPLTDALDLRGREFLKLYFLASLAAFVASFIIAALLRTRPAGIPAKVEDRYEIAFLGGGGARVMDVAITVLYGRQLLTVDSDINGHPLVRTSAELPADLHEIERKVLGAMPMDKRVHVHTLRHSLKPVFDGLQESLAARGLVETPASLRFLRWMSLLPMLLVLLIGGAKMVVGLERGKPVSYLLIMVLVLVVVMVVRARRIKAISSAGEKAWAELKANPPVTRSAIERSDSSGLADPYMTGLMVALVGAAALQHTSSYAALNSSLYRPSDSGSGNIGGCSSGCGADSSSGDSGGDGGGGSSGCSSGCGGCGGGGGGD